MFSNTILLYFQAIIGARIANHTSPFGDELEQSTRSGTRIQEDPSAPEKGRDPGESEEVSQSKSELAKYLNPKTENFSTPSDPTLPQLTKVLPIPHNA